MYIYALYNTRENTFTLFRLYLSGKTGGRERARLLYCTQGANILLKLGRTWESKNTCNAYFYELGIKF